MWRFVPLRPDAVNARVMATAPHDWGTAPSMALRRIAKIKSTTQQTPTHVLRRSEEGHLENGYAGKAINPEGVRH